MKRILLLVTGILSTVFSGAVFVTMLAMILPLLIDYFTDTTGWAALLLVLLIAFGIPALISLILLVFNVAITCKWKSKKQPKALIIINIVFMALTIVAGIVCIFTDVGTYGLIALVLIPFIILYSIELGREKKRIAKANAEVAKAVEIDEE